MTTLFDTASCLAFVLAAAALVAAPGIEIGTSATASGIVRYRGAGYLIPLGVAAWRERVTGGVLVVLGLRLAMLCLQVLAEWQSACAQMVAAGRIVLQNADWNNAG